jgi:hypothetical protein
MDRGTLSTRIARLRAECAAIGQEIAESGGGLDPVEWFEVAGELQGLVNSAEGAQGAAAAYGARVETTMHESGPWQRVHPVGYVDAMAPTEMSAATALTEGLAGRKVALGAALAERFPGVRALLLAGDLPAASAHKVVDACAGLDVDACLAVDAALAPRLTGLDPTRVTSAAREVAERVAAEQVAAHQERNRRVRTVQVRPSEDGLSEWWALLPTEKSTAMWAAVEQLAADTRRDEPELSVEEARADALADLVLENVTVEARVTLGIPVITGPSDAEPEWDPDGWVRTRVERGDDETVIDAVTGEETRMADLTPESREEFSWYEEPPDGHPAAGAPTPARFAEQAYVSPGVTVGGCDLRGVGFIPANVMAGLLRTLPLEVTRAMLEADTGTLASVTTGAYSPTPAMREFVTIRDGTCRAWGCARPASHVDLDHTRPWPDGHTGPTNLAGLCRRHHRMKQRGRWRYRLDPDGTVEWISTSGQVRVTEPQHRPVIPPGTIIALTAPQAASAPAPGTSPPF